MQNRRKRRVFSKEFKKEVVDLHRTGKSRKEILIEYDLTPSAFDKWVTQFSELSLCNPNNENVKQMQKEDEYIEKLKRENEKLLLENDVLKQAVLIFGKLVE